MQDAAIVRDEHPSLEAFAIVEKYEAFLNYAYPKVQNCPRKHGVVRDAVLDAMVAPVPSFYAAGKSRQVSRLYQLDAELATLRFWLRFMAHPERRIITRHVQEVALGHLNEVGRMLGAWIRKSQPQRSPDGSADAARRRPMGREGK